MASLTKEKVGALRNFLAICSPKETSWRLVTCTWPPSPLAFILRGNVHVQFVHVHNMGTICNVQQDEIPYLFPRSMAYSSWWNFFSLVLVSSDISLTVWQSSWGVQEERAVQRSLV